VVELAQALVADAEVVGDLMQDDPPDLVPEDDGIPAVATLERAREVHHGGLAGRGGTASTIDCDGEVSFTDPNGDGGQTHNDLEPGTYTCTVVVDP